MRPGAPGFNGWGDRPDPGAVQRVYDESKAGFLEERGNEAIAANPAVRHVVLVCPAVNRRLEDGGSTFRLSEVKGPVMDRLTRVDAVSSIKPDLARGAREAGRGPQPAPSGKESRS